MNTKKPIAKVYIDGANVFYTQKDIAFVIDWGLVRGYLLKNWQVVDFRYYTGLKTDDNKMRKYLKYLDGLGFAVITKPLKEIHIEENHPMAQLHNYTKVYKCNFDVEITTDILLDRTNIDEVLLFSGDSDFEYLVKKLRDIGKRTTVFSSRAMIAWELKLAVDKYIFLEDLRDIIARKDIALQ